MAVTGSNVSMPRMRTTEKLNANVNQHLLHEKFHVNAQQRSALTLKHVKD